MVKAGEQDPRRMGEAAARHEQALALWLDRFTFKEIAERLGYYDASGARKAVMTALEETAARTVGLAEAARPQIAAKVERLYERWADKADDDLKAGEFVLRIVDRLVKIYGLEKIRVEATVTTRTQLDAEIEQLLGKVQHPNPNPTPERNP